MHALQAGVQSGLPRRSAVPLLSQPPLPCRAWRSHANMPACHRARGKGEDGEDEVVGVDLSSCGQVILNLPGCQTAYYELRALILHKGHHFTAYFRVLKGELLTACAIEPVN